MSFYNNVGSLREGEMFLSEDNKVLQVFKEGRLSVINPSPNNENIFDITRSWSLHMDRINNVSYVWDHRYGAWLSFKLRERDMNTASQASRL